MYTRHATRTAATLPVVFMLGAGVLAQCPPQRLSSPSDFAGDFGFAVAMNDRHLLVGDWRDYTLCGDPFCANGYAWAYERDVDGLWSLTQRIEPADLGWSYGFGRNIALDGDRALITRTLGPDCGGVPYLFEFDGDRWIEIDRLCPPPGRGGDGNPLGMHGDMALTNTSDEDVLVFFEEGGAWRFTQEISSPDSPSVRSDFGAAFDLNDEWVVIGAFSERIVAANGGAAYVYRRLPGGQIQFAQKLAAPDILDGPRFGSAIALDHATLAIGGVNADGLVEVQGATYVFTLNDGVWEFNQKLTHSDPARADRFGASIALNGDTMVVGAYTKQAPWGTGAAYAFRRAADGVWREAGQFVPQLQTYAFGFAVGLSAGSVAIGAADASTGAGSDGAVDIFDLACVMCPPDLDADGELTIYDFLAYLNLFQDGAPLADFDGDGELTIFDFLAFQTAFEAGCG